MAPKKKNAFFLFCEEYRREHSKDGYNMSLKQAMENGAQLWDVSVSFCVQSHYALIVAYYLEIERA